MFDLAPGTLVGARRWPCAASHPDGWGRPWTGVVLAQDDPSAWAGSVAFPVKRPNRAEVAAHVARFPGLRALVPVRWSFGEAVARVFWERREAVRHAAEDVAAWERERAEARACRSTVQAAA